MSGRKGLDEVISLIRTLSKEEKSEVALFLKSTEEEKEDIRIPVEIFTTGILGPLEAIVKYLKEICGQKTSKMARSLNRSEKTVWTTYSKASKKMPGKYQLAQSILQVPISVFSKGKFSALESLALHLRKLGHSNHEIAAMLKLDDRTIWTVCDRAGKKAQNE